MVNMTGILPIKLASCLQKHCYPPHLHLMPKRRRAALASAQNGLKAGEERPEKRPCTTTVAGKEVC